jgi:hypothetical protein
LRPVRDGLRHIKCMIKYKYRWFYEKIYEGNINYYFNGFCRWNFCF